MCRFEFKVPHRVLTRSQAIAIRAKLRPILGAKLYIAHLSGTEIASVVGTTLTVWTKDEAHARAIERLLADRLAIATTEVLSTPVLTVNALPRQMSEWSSTTD